MENIKSTNSTQNKYSKDKFIQSNIYTAFDKDILKIILEDDTKYSKSEVEERLKEFKKMEIKVPKRKDVK